MVDFKKVKAPNNTVTRNPAVFSAKAGNIYEAVAIIAKRANQISVEMKDELSRKLQEFASYADNLEEIFENRELIEFSKYYERIPKPVLIATQEFLDDEIYFRNPATEKDREKVAKED
ncbi:DNA-directed RNA polymerase subunit omega [Odoribacter laneus]|uniref:DNA-directed RNA polymerase subunit omega n=1 Tax=Odoribacter laneus TaxID=626933 RepID=UPI003AB7E56A